MSADATARSGRERGSSLWDELKASFGFPAGVAMLLGLALGFGLPAIDEWLGIEIPTFAFDTQEAARGLLETVATVTVTVAGIAFSVTVVALSLTAQQLSPRVLRNFSSDRLSQAVLAFFLGTFIFCLSVLVRLGAGGDDAVPNLSITVAILLALASFGLFAFFVGHIARMLRPSSVIATIVEDAKDALGTRFPAGAGGEPERPAVARAEVDARVARSSLPVTADGEGYLRLVQGERLVESAKRCDGLVRQRPAVGDYVTPGQGLADVWADDLSEQQREALAADVRAAFLLGQERSLVQDTAFSVRQLADVALKGLSPGINDPTTAENAMEAMAAVLIRFAGSERPSPIRVDGDGRARFVAHVPSLDDLVRLGFEQVRVFAAPYPVVSLKLIDLLERIGDASERAGVDHTETLRQIALIREGPEGEVPTVEDAARVRRASLAALLRGRR